MSKTMSKLKFAPSDEARFSDFDAVQPWSRLDEWGEQQDYKFCALVYPDCTSYNLGRTAEDILTIVRNWGFSEWYYVLHDRDIKPDGSPKKSHYHILIKTSTPCRIKNIANVLGIPSNFVQRVKSFKSMAKYLVHDETSDKEMYLAEEVVCSDTQSYLKYFDARNENEEALKIFEYIVHSGCQSYLQLVEWCCKNDYYSTLRRNASMWSNCVKENLRFGGKEF